MPNLGPMEILVVLVVALVVLGPKRLPEAGRQVGKAMSEIRKWSSTMQNEVKSVMDFDEEAPPPKSWNPDATTPASMAVGSDPPPVTTPGEAGSMSADIPPPPPTDSAPATPDPAPPADTATPVEAGPEAEKPTTNE